MQEQKARQGISRHGFVSHCRKAAAALPAASGKDSSARPVVLPYCPGRICWSRAFSPALFRTLRSRHTVPAQSRTEKFFSNQGRTCLDVQETGNGWNRQSALLNARLQGVQACVPEAETKVDTSSFLPGRRSEDSQGGRTPLSFFKFPMPAQSQTAPQPPRQKSDNGQPGVHPGRIQGQTASELPSYGGR